MFNAEQLPLVYTGASLLALLVTWYAAIRPRVRRVTRRFSIALDTFTGRDETLDEVTGETLPAVKPLHSRLVNIEATVAMLADQRRILVDHEARIVSLEDVEAERALTREESAAIWRVLADRGVIDIDGTEEPK